MPSNPNLGTVVSRRKTLPSEGNADDRLYHAFSLFLNHAALTYWFWESGLEPFFATPGGEVSYNCSEGEVSRKKGQKWILRSCTVSPAQFPTSAPARATPAACMPAQSTAC